MARLIRIQQDGSYSDYVKKFVTYSAHLPHMEESVLHDAFLSGLEPNLQAKVVNRYPQTLEECTREAQLVNDRSVAMKLTKTEGRTVEPKKKEEYAGKIQEGTDKGYVRKTDFPMKQVIIPIEGSYQKSEPPIKRLSDAEFKSRLDKGL